MTEIRWTDGAIRDLEAIRIYIDADSPAAAERVALSLVVAADGLAVLPDRGRPIGGDMRELTQIRPYIIRYRHDQNAALVEILTVWHGARQTP